MARGARRAALLRAGLLLAALAALSACAGARSEPPAVAVVPVTVVVTVVASVTPAATAPPTTVPSRTVDDPGTAVARQESGGRGAGERATQAIPAPNEPSPIASASPVQRPTVTTSPTVATSAATVTAATVPTPAATPPTVVPPPATATTSLPPVTATTAPPPATDSSPPTTFLSPAPLAAAEPWISETTITIPTYDYEAAFLPTAPDDPVYPYPRLDPALVGPPTPRAYRAIVLQNGFVAVTILPELGGRVYRWVDKATGENLLYENPVVKPTGWGYRGWWLAAGGIEWAFPTSEHGLNEYRPWAATTGTTPYGLSVTVSDVDSRTGMEVGATISLDAGHSWITIQPWARNGTAEAHSYQLWLNAMLALNGNGMSGQTRFIVPASEVIVHSTGDGGAPGSGAVMGWPVHSGRDMSVYGNWTGYLGFFAPNPVHGFTGVYDAAADQGIVRVFNPGWPAGTKIFGPATLPSGQWTDDGSGYVELWSGATSSFWSAATLPPNETFSWTEQWYPVRGLGGLSYANRVAALRLNEASGVVEAHVAVPARFEGRVRLLVDGQVAGEWPVTIVPGQVFRASWPRPSGGGGLPSLQLLGLDGTVVAETGFGF